LNIRPVRKDAAIDTVTHDQNGDPSPKDDDQFDGERRVTRRP
jgi:hypothetical protein